MDQKGSPAGRELQQRPGVGSAGGPPEHEVDGLGFALKEGHGDFAGRERFPHMPHQQIDYRGPAQSARYFLPEGGEPSDQVEVEI